MADMEAGLGVSAGPCRCACVSLDYPSGSDGHFSMGFCPGPTDPGRWNQGMLQRAEGVMCQQFQGLKDSLTPGNYPMFAVLPGSWLWLQAWQSHSLSRGRAGLLPWAQVKERWQF